MSGEPKTKQEIIDLLEKFCIENKISISAGPVDQIEIVDFNPEYPIQCLAIYDAREGSEEFQS